MAPSIEFDCGTVVHDIGAIGLACRAHIGKCDNDACQTEVTETAKKAGLL